MSIINGPTKESSSTLTHESFPPRRSAAQDVLGIHHEAKDVLKQLQTNVQLLEDLSGRIAFVLTEVRSLIKR